MGGGLEIKLKYVYFFFYLWARRKTFTRRNTAETDAEDDVVEE
ncbi:unnamed protein product [Brassica oleracea]